jgi:beta-glucosidase
LFGDYNPSGRLPLTFYASTKELPDFEDYSMKNRTYRYYKGQAIYPFGHGLSYTNFKYRKAKLSAKTIRPDESVTLQVRVKNTGRMDGAEVVQVYVRNPKDVDGPIKSLRQFARIEIPAGSSVNVPLELNYKSFECFDAATGRMKVQPGNYEILYGSSSDEKMLKRLTINVQ